MRFVWALTGSASAICQLSRGWGDHFSLAGLFFGAMHRHR
jgi:hypothetical protein